MSGESIARLRPALIAICLSLVSAACMHQGGASQGASAPLPANGPGGGLGQMYLIDGTYYSVIASEDDETGIASWYGQKFDGRRTASGDVFDSDYLTAAHRTLEFGSLVRIVNLDEGKAVVVRINDRGPFHGGRVVDVSRRAAELLAFKGDGMAPVRLQVLKPEMPVVNMVAPRRPARSIGVQVASTGPIGISLPNNSASRLPEIVETIPPGHAGIFVQVDTFSDRSKARDALAELKDLGPGTLVERRIDNRIAYRLRIGPIATVEDADAMLKRVDERGHHHARIVVE